MKLKYFALGFLSIFISCRNSHGNKQYSEIRNTFNLKKDYIHFKEKMNENDTINISIEHSVCSYFGKEKIQITKKNDSIKITTDYFERKGNRNAEWIHVFDKTITKNDTIWDFGKFIETNKYRFESKNRIHPRIQITHKLDTIKLFTYGLNDLYSFMIDYDNLMTKIYSNYTKDSIGIHSTEIIECNDIEIKESEMKN